MALPPFLPVRFSEFETGPIPRRSSHPVYSAKGNNNTTSGTCCSSGAYHGCGCGCEGCMCRLTDFKEQSNHEAYPGEGGHQVVPRLDMDLLTYASSFSSSSASVHIDDSCFLSDRSFDNSYEVHGHFNGHHTAGVNIAGTGHQFAGSEEEEDGHHAWPQFLSPTVLKRIENLTMDTSTADFPLTSGGQKQLLYGDDMDDIGDIMHDIGEQQWLPSVEAGPLLPPNTCDDASTCDLRDPWIHHMASSPTENQIQPQNHNQGATCQPLETTIPLQYYQQAAANFLPGPSWAPNPPTMQAFTPTPPLLAYDSSPDQLEQFSDMDGLGLDYEILNNPTYLNDFNLTGYYNDFGLTDYNDFNLPDYNGDFTLYPTNESFIQSSYPNDDSLFPSLPSYDSPASVAPADANANPFPALPTYDSPVSEGTPPTHRFQCPFATCTESFPRQCELTRHEYKHTRPFKCPHCGRAFAEKRRCVQHVQSVHDLATDKDKTKCQLCNYAHVRPDAVKRHLRLKHGVGAKTKGSPSSSVSGESSQGPGRRKGGGRAR